MLTLTVVASYNTTWHYIQSIFLLVVGALHLNCPLATLLSQLVPPEYPMATVCHLLPLMEQ